MADRLIRSETLAQIANAIRIKNETAGVMSPGDMEELILQTGFSGIPGYHDLAVMEVLDKLRALRGNVTNLLVFGVMGDSHVNVGTEYEALTKVSARHAAFALENAGRWAGCTFFANLGDNCWSGDMDSAEDAAGAAYLSGCIAAGFGHIRSYRLVGECDRASDPRAVYTLNGAHNVFDEAALTARRGFGYTDYPGENVRVIVLNTSDCCGAAAGFGMSYEQKAFLMHALDLSDLPNYQQWQILILSHYPLDYPNDVRYNTAADVKAILTAYVNGGTAEITVQSAYAAAEEENPADYTGYSGGKLSYDYSGINSPRIIANIHGHIHNACVGTMAGHGITRVSTPNACFYQDDKYAAGLYAADVSYPKTANTAEDTAVTIYAVDLDNGVIHSIAYGAGEDRVIPYL